MSQAYVLLLRFSLSSLHLISVRSLLGTNFELWLKISL